MKICFGNFFGISGKSLKKIVVEDEAHMCRGQCVLASSRERNAAATLERESSSRETYWEADQSASERR